MDGTITISFEEALERKPHRGTGEKDFVFSARELGGIARLIFEDLGSIPRRDSTLDLDFIVISIFIIVPILIVVPILIIALIFIAALILIVVLILIAILILLSLLFSLYHQVYYPY
jgi:hypothetical protein